MKRFIRAAIPYLTAILILAGGSGLNLFLRNIMPDHTGVISMNEAQGDAYYVEGDNAIYPWDILTDEDISLSQWLSENGIDGTFTSEEVLSRSVDIFTDGEIAVTLTGDVAEKLKIRVTGSDVYLYGRNIPCSTVDGEVRLASIVWKNDVLICMDIARDDEVFHIGTDGSAAVSAYLTYMRNSQYHDNTVIEESEGEISVTDDGLIRANPINRALERIMRLYGNDTSYRQYSIYELVMRGSYYTVNLDGEVKLVMTDSSGTLIMDYDPITSTVTGFTLNESTGNSR